MVVLEVLQRLDRLPGLRFGGFHLRDVVGGGGIGISSVHAFARPIDAHVDISRTIPHGMTISIAHGAFPARLLDAA